MSGLDRYDGYTCKVFRNKHDDTTSLTDNYIATLFPLPDGKMWIVTRDVPCIYNSMTEKFDRNCSRYLRSLGLPVSPITDIKKRGNGRFWFLYDSLDLYLYSSEEKRARPFRPQNVFYPSARITSVEETTDGFLWIVYQNGLLQKLDILSKKIVFTTDALQKVSKGNYRFRLFIDKEGFVWVRIVNMQKGVFVYNPQVNSLKQINEGTSPRLNTNLIT